MNIDYIKKKFLEYGFNTNNFKREGEKIIFAKGNIEFNFIDQQLDGWELYFKIINSPTIIKIDFTLEVFSNKRSIEDIVKLFKGRMSQSDYLSYLFFLLFKESIFLIKENNEKTKQFINWYNESSDEVYENYLKEVKARKIM